MWGYVDDAGLALDHDGLSFVEGACDEGDAARAGSLDLRANPLGTGASLTEASACEDHPGVPVAIGRELGVAGVEIPVVLEPSGLPCWKATLVGARGGATQVLGQRFNMGGDGVYTVDAGECGESFNVHSDYVSGDLSSSECDG